jgi:hypothetical protein
MPIDFQSVLSTLEDKIKDLAKSSFKDFASNAEKDGREILNILKDDLIRWTELLAAGQLTKGEFGVLLIGNKDLVKMAALKQAGLTLARIDEFKTAVFNLIFDTISSLV